MAEPLQVTRIPVPNDWSPSDKRAFGKQVVQFIKERTDRGVDVNGNKFAGYSESYVNSLDFKNAGKSKGEVNLRLTNEMMDTLDVVSVSSDEVWVGFEQGTAPNDKAAWAAAGDNGPSRKFLGIKDADLAAMIDRFEVEMGIDSRRGGDLSQYEAAARDVRITSRVLDRALSSLLFEDLEDE